MAGGTDTRRVHTGARPGGRSERVRAAIIEATILELREVGYGELTMSAIAKRADVALSTVLRRWDTKAALMAEVVVELTAEAIPAPDLGSLDRDLRAYARLIVDYLRDPTINALIRGTTVLPSAERKMIGAQTWQSRAQVAHDVMHRAIGRGDIPAQENPLRIVEFLSAQLWVRVLFSGGPVDDEALDRLVDDVMTIARAG